MGKKQEMGVEEAGDPARGITQDELFGLCVEVST